MGQWIGRTRFLPGGWNGHIVIFRQVSLVLCALNVVRSLRLRSSLNLSLRPLGKPTPPAHARPHLNTGSQDQH